MDSLHEDVTMRTLFKGMIAEDVPQSAVRPGKWRLQTTKGTPKKSTDVQTQESPRMLLRSQMKAKIRRTRNQITATAGSSAKYSTRNKSSALTKSKRFEAMHQENVDNDTPRQLLKKFMQTELESSLVKVPTPKTKTSVKNMSQSKTKSLSDSDRLSLNLPEKDTEEHTLPGDLKFRNRKKVSVSEFENALQQRLNYTTEPQEGEKSIRPPDISTIVGYSLINPDFEESTTKPILCRRPLKRKVISEDDFEEGVHNYLEQDEEPDETEKSEAFEKTGGLTDISRLVSSINFGFDETVSVPVLIRRPRRTKLINEDDFEGGVLFHLQQAEEIVIISHIQENDGYREDLEMPEQNLPIRDRQESPSMQHPEGMLVDETVEGHDVNDGRDEDGETVDILEDTGRMEYAEEDGENADGPKMDNGRVGTEGGESRKDVEAVTERMQGAKIKELGSLELDSDSADAAELDSSSADVLVLDNNRVDGPGLDSSSGNAAGLDGSRKGASGLDGSRKGASGLDGSRKGAPGLDGSRKVASGLDGSRKVASRLDGSMAGASRLDGNMAGASGLDESRKGASGLDGSRKVASGLDGSMLGASGLDGSMPGASGLDGSMAGASGLDGSMAGASGLDGSMAGVSGLDGSRKGVSRLDGSRKGVSRLDGSMAGASGLDGSMAGASRLDGSMAGASGLDGSMSGASRLDGSMAGASGLDGSMAGASGLDGSRKGASRLDSSRKGTSRLDGSMAGASGLGGSMSGASGLGSNMAGTSGLASGSRAGASRLDDDKLAGGETDNARMEDTESDGDTESDEMDVEELMHNIEYEKDDSKVSSSEKLLKSSPLLTTPHFLKILGRRAQKPLAKVNNPRKPKQIRKKTVLPSSFVKSVFNHYAKMRVKKESFGAINQCLELYFKQLCDDMDVYSKHAKRRTIEKEDLELLMKRQGFVTAKMPLNVLIENHLSMECREKLIPMAVSGNKMIPKK
ncbi:centromere protein T isoform X10 [Amblyraja radiata]|uniref:centromere protein T isoform X10 n=1 Tax=Amblyraja radiata TaxID=386614 RepID=UPI0014033714|nr:centromere protein T isoform X10 [Amblyraja radiata]